jgi:hypothetical protein
VTNVVALASARTVSIRNERELKQFIKHHTDASPLELVEAIHLSLNLATSSADAARDHRLYAGLMLLECRYKVEAEGEDWWQWQKGKFKRSRKDIEKLMRLASADDPAGQSRMNGQNKNSAMLGSPALERGPLQWSPGAPLERTCAPI